MRDREVLLMLLLVDLLLLNLSFVIVAYVHYRYDGSIDEQLLTTAKRLLGPYSVRR